MTTHSGDVLTEEDMDKLLNDAFNGALPEKAASETPAAPVEAVTSDTEPKEAQDAGATPPATDTPATNDPLATLPEDARAIVQAEIQRLQRERDQATQNYNAQLGRVRALEKQKQQLVQAPKPATPEPKAAEDDWLKDVRGVDPELAKYLEQAESRAAAKAAQQFEAKLDELRQREIAPLQHSRVQEEALREEQILDQTVPNWRSAAEDPHFQAYAQALPPFMQEKLQNTTKADELLWFFDDYNRRFFPNAAQGGDPVKASAQAAATPPSVTAQRQQKLAASVAPAGSTPAPKPDVVDEAKLLAEAYDTVSSARYNHKR
jgi:hypothetical protein